MEQNEILFKEQNEDLFNIMFQLWEELVTNIPGFLQPMFLV